MQECATGGYSVVLNVAEFRSDAILISSRMGRSIHLSDLSVREAEVWLRKDWTFRRAESARKNSDYSDSLAWIWQSCVKRITDEIRTGHESQEGELLRVW